MGSKLESQDLKPAEILWREQGQQYHAYYSQMQAKQSGLLDLISKEQAGHLNLSTFEAWAEESLGVGMQANDEVPGSEQNRAGMDLQDAAPCALVGVAAQSAKPSGVWPSTPTGAKRIGSSPPSLLRTPSSMSLGSAAGGEGGAATTASATGSNLGEPAVPSLETASVASSGAQLQQKPGSPYLG